MADYAGAVAALRAAFVAAWTETPIAFQNEPFEDQSAAPWVFFEVLSTASDRRGAGLPGNNTWLTQGIINIHVFTPLNYGYPESLRLADAAGDVFRAATLYQTGNAKVVCGAPQTDGGGSGDDDGIWFRVTTVIPFEFFFNK